MYPVLSPNCGIDLSRFTPGAASLAVCFQRPPVPHCTPPPPSPPCGTPALTGEIGIELLELAVRPQPPDRVRA